MERKIMDKTLGERVGICVEQLASEGRLCQSVWVSYFEMAFTIETILQNDFYVYKDKGRIWKHPVPACRIIRELFRIVERDTGHEGLSLLDVIDYRFMKKYFVDFEPEKSIE